MAVLAAGRVSMHFTGPLLLDSVSVAVEPGAKVGLIGRNGSGKSTLLKLLAGRLDPTGGAVTRQRGTTVDYQAQELEYAPGASVRDELRAVFAADARRDARLRELEGLVATESDAAARARLLTEYEALQREHETRGVYDVERRIETMLMRLGVPEDAWDRPIDRFSGGERNVLGLARVLLREPDVMLLDEPSNHLDMDGVEWFIDFVRRTEKAVVMVSHNRHLLDATTREIWELRRKKVTAWTGNYSDFQQQKAEALALQERQYKTQQRLIRRLEFQARRLRDMARAYDDPGQAKRAKAMQRRVEQMDKVERPDTGEARFAASLAGAARHGRLAVHVHDFSFAYGDRVLFDRASLEIEYGDRVCLVGPNGSGKTTLFRQLLDHGSWEHDTLRLGKSARIGEYRQLHDDALDADRTLEEWAAHATGLPRSEAAALLHRFLFTRDDLARTIGTLSGGEKSRLQLARLAHEKVNLLFLDEPTNHLDIQACEQLEEMLEEYDGTLFVISHDRYFLDRLVNRVVEVSDQQLVLHRCGFAEWWERKREAGHERRGTALEDRRATDEEGKEEARRRFAERKERARELGRLRTRLKELEQRIESLEERQSELEARLADLYSQAEHPPEAARVSKDLDATRSELTALYGEWETVAAEAADS